VKHGDKSISPEDVAGGLRDRFGMEVKIYYQSCCTEDDEGQEGECLRWRLVLLSSFLSFLLFSDCLKLV
jgi:hypothetical protein